MTTEIGAGNAVTLACGGGGAYMATERNRGTEMSAERKVFRIAGDDRHEFLQGLVTNSVPKEPGKLVYSALLTPQGKYLADFFLVEIGDALLLDASAEQAPGLLRRLMLYKLRSKVTIEETDTPVARGTGTPPDGALPDPRHPDLGWRHYGGTGEDGTDWEALRVAHCIPETGIELVPEETFILEAGLDRLNGVDFRKGCFVGQEIVARMKHKTELRKGLARVAVDGAAPVGTEITAGGKSAGRLYTQSGGEGIAYLRFDRAEGEMQAGDARVTRLS
jgi:folate-binding protein YgfZ